MLFTRELQTLTRVLADKDNVWSDCPEILQQVHALQAEVATIMKTILKTGIVVA